MVLPGAIVPNRNPKDRRGQFEEAALPHLDSLYTAALRLTHSTQDSQDLVQEAVLRGYRNFHQFQPGTNCRAWLLTIMYNLFRTAYRRGGREQPAATAEEFEHEIESLERTGRNDGDPAELLERRRAGRTLEQALARLPPDFRECLLLVDVHELDYQEAALVLDVPLGTVKSRVSRGRSLMRQALKTSKNEDLTGEFIINRRK